MVKSEAYFPLLLSSHMWVLGLTSVVYSPLWPLLSRHTHETQQQYLSDKISSHRIDMYFILCPKVKTFKIFVHFQDTSKTKQTNKNSEAGIYTILIIPYFIIP